MYSIVFVDDESIIREGISSCIRWQEVGFDLVAMFENGHQVLEYLEGHEVDIILSDIKMPKVDGLELAREVNQRFPQVMMLLLSGYDDFEYAQEAMKYNVQEFLLKPITASELTKTLVSVKKKLDDRLRERKEIEGLRERLEESLPLLRERFLYRLVSGKLSGQAIAERAAVVHWEDRRGAYQVVVIHPNDHADDLQRIYLSQFVQQLLEKHDEILFNRDDNLVLILQGPSQDDRGYVLARRIFTDLSKRDGSGISIGCGEVVDRAEKISLSYRGAVTALEYLKVLGVSRILRISEIRGKQSASVEHYNHLVSGLLQELKVGRLEDTLKALSQIFEFFEQSYLTLQEASFFLVRLHSMLQDFLQEFDLVEDTEEVIPYQTDYFVSINQARGFFVKALSDIDRRIRERRNSITTSRIHKAEAIIQRRYRQKNFSLQDICDELYLSTSQFSLLFKEGTGKTFVEYLTAYRIEQAKIQLKSSALRAYEIAELVGFSDPRYFSIIFKKQTGMTPLEYRRSVE